LPAAADSAISKERVWIDEKLVITGLLDLDALRTDFPGPVLVVDLRTSAEGVADEQAKAEKLGMSYRNVPVAGTAILDE
jgi:hypothetical protein